MSEQFLVTECFFNLFLESNKVEQLYFKQEKIIGIQNHAGKVRKRCLSSEKNPLKILIDSTFLFAVVVYPLPTKRLEVDFQKVMSLSTKRLKIVLSSSFFNLSCRNLVDMDIFQAKTIDSSFPPNWQVTTAQTPVNPG